MQMIIRDDDTSFFTTPARLEQLYTPLWELSLPVCLCVIPAHYGNTIIPTAEPFVDPNIAPQYRGQDKYFPITDNPEICAFLREKVEKGLVEICLHGYSHDWMEFKSDDRALLDKKLSEGRAILQQAVPKAALHTFVAPYGGVTDIAVQAIFDAGYHTMLDVRSVPQGEGYPTAPEHHRVYLTPHGLKLFTGGIADYSGDIARWLESLAHTDATICCINHYYMFYQDFGAIEEKPYREWQAFMRLIRNRYADCVTTYRDAVVPS